MTKASGSDFGSDVEDIPDKDLSHTSAGLWGLQCGKATLDPRRPPPDDDQVSRSKMEAWPQVLVRKVQVAQILWTLLMAIWMVCQ